MRGFRDFSEILRGPLRDPLSGRFRFQRLLVLLPLLVLPLELSPTQILGHPGRSLSKTTEEGHLHKVLVRDIPTSLKALTSLNKEVRPFFLGDKSIWSFPSVSSLSDYSIWRS